MKSHERDLLLVAAVSAQAADLLTMSPYREVNPIALDPLGTVAKLVLMLALVAGSVALGRRWDPVLLLAFGIGIIGFVSNIR